METQGGIENQDFIICWTCKQKQICDEVVRKTTAFKVDGKWKFLCEDCTLAHERARDTHANKED